MAFIECVIFLLMLNISLYGKYEPKPDDIAPSVRVSHYECSEMKENNLYSLNQVEPCNMAPQNFEMNDVKLTTFKKHFEPKSLLQFAESSNKETDFIAGSMILPVWISNNQR